MIRPFDDFGQYTNPSTKCELICRILSRLMLLTTSYGTRQTDFDHLVKKARSEIDTLVSCLLFGGEL